MSQPSPNMHENHNDDNDGRNPQNGWLSHPEFAKVVELTSLVSVDLLIFNVEGKILLGKRANEPAKGMWFTPGGRINKFEKLEDSIQRISKNEVAPILPLMSQPPLHGVYRHMYEVSRFPLDTSSTDVWRSGTDYINFAYRLSVLDHYNPDDIEKTKGDGQHLPDSNGKIFHWFSIEDLLTNPEVDPYVKCYFHPHAWNRIV